MAAATTLLSDTLPAEGGAAESLQGCGRVPVFTDSLPDTLAPDQE